MQLCLVVPGLLWPRQAHYDSTYDLELPSLARLLGRGRIRWETALPYENWLGRSCGIAAEEMPAAALRLLGGGTDPGGDPWLCADAAHLSMEGGAPALAAVGLNDVDSDQAQQLTASLAPLLAELGEFRLDAGGRGYVRLKQDAGMATTPPSAAIGRRPDLVEPRGSDARSWRRMANEVQIALHTHPVNRRREDAGMQAVNTLWFWGAGRLPRSLAAPAWNTLHAGDASTDMARGIAAWSGIQLQALGSDFSDLVDADRGLVCLDQLLPARLSFDATAWRDALLQIEARWFAPSDRALRQGSVAKLTIVGLGDDAALVATLTPWRRRQFWHRPRALAECQAEALP